MWKIWRKNEENIFFIFPYKLWDWGKIPLYIAYGFSLPPPVQAFISLENSRNMKVEMCRKYKWIREYMLSYTRTVGLGKIPGLPAVGGWQRGFANSRFRGTPEKKHEICQVTLQRARENLEVFCPEYNNWKLSNLKTMSRLSHSVIISFVTKMTPHSWEGGRGHIIYLEHRDFHLKWWRKNYIGS